MVDDQIFRESFYTSYLKQGLTSELIAAFQAGILDYYQEHERDLPWRQTTDPYLILISEIMSQQTQIDRVVTKYLDWMHVFPDFETLASASLKDVLAVWSGLGYNRRAKHLHLLAQEVMDKHAGVLPQTKEDLLSLPGIGPYTTSSVMAFAFDLPVVVIDTNIRSVFIWFFFREEEVVDDKNLIPVIQKVIYQPSPRLWYNALMDYGAHLKSLSLGSPAKSKHYAKQSAFNGSDRQIRGQVLRLLLKEDACSLAEIVLSLEKDPHRLKQVLAGMLKEGLISKDEGEFSIAS